MGMMEFLASEIEGLVTKRIRQEKLQPNLTVSMGCPKNQAQDFFNIILLDTCENPEYKNASLIYLKIEDKILRIKRYILNVNFLFLLHCQDSKTEISMLESLIRFFAETPSMLVHGEKITIFPNILTIENKLSLYKLLQLDHFYPSLSYTATPISIDIVQNGITLPIVNNEIEVSIGLSKKTDAIENFPIGEESLQEILGNHGFKAKDYNKRKKNGTLWEVSR